MSDEIKRLLEAIKIFREAFVTAVGNTSPFAKTALDVIDDASKPA